MCSSDLLLLLWLLRLVVLLVVLRRRLSRCLGLRRGSTGRHERWNRETSAYPEGELGFGMLGVFWWVAEVLTYRRLEALKRRDVVEGDGFGLRVSGLAAARKLDWGSGPQGLVVGMAKTRGLSMG